MRRGLAPSCSTAHTAGAAPFRRLVSTGLAALILALAACGPGANDTPAARDTAIRQVPAGTRVDLTGAGATFPYPLYARWFNEYAQRTGVRINYQSIGSGGGIRQVIAHTIDFGATDVPMTDEEIAQAKSPVLHIPTVLGAVAITYNLPDVTRPLNLSGPVVADVFLGRITRWNDPRVAELNDGVALPDREILVVHRADGSGTSYIFSNYLATVSEAWRTRVGSGRDVRWPVGVGGKGNEGVAGQVKQMPGSIGYVEVVYARQNRLPTAHVRNRTGRFVSPLPFEVATAAATVTDSLPPTADLRVSLVDAPGAQSYPIASFTWILLAPETIGPERTRQLVDFLRWALTEGDQVAGTLGYVALPQETARRVLTRLDAIAPAR